MAAAGRLRAWLVCGVGLALHGCAASPRPADDVAARSNAASLYTMPVNLFGRPETGWAVYAPRVEADVGSDAPAGSARFASALARWRRRLGGPDDGALDIATLQALKRRWQAERPFMRLRAQGVCPPAPSEARMVLTDAAESYGGRLMQVRRGALAAYRRMVADARRAEPALASHPDILEIFSAYRSPEWDAARCAAQNNCQGVVRAACSAHRTGLALDLVLDAAPGYPVDSTADPNRLAMARGLAYRWLVANASRYGFVNYVFEPWHWEWAAGRQ